MTHHEEAEAAVRTMSGLGVRAIRLLYTDLHGVARGKDIPIRPFRRDVPTRASHSAPPSWARTSATRRSSEARRDTSTSRSSPSLNTLRSVPWQPEVAWCLGEAWTLDGSEHWPSCPRALLQRVVDAYAERGLSPVVAPELEFFLAERDPEAENGLRRYVDELSRVYTVGAVSDPREIVLKMLLWCDELGLEAFAANHEFMNSQYEINIKHAGALEAADRAFMLKAAVKEIAAREGSAGDLHGQAVRGPGRLGLPRPPLARGRRRQQRVRRRGRAGRLEPARRELHRRRDRARPGPPGAARPDDQRLQADPPGQPRAHACELGPRQPHGLLPGAERARLAGPGRGPHGRRLRLPAPDHRGRSARGSRRDRARTDPPDPSSAMRTGSTRPTPARRCRPASAPRSTRSRRTRL